MGRLYIACTRDSTKASWTVRFGSEDTAPFCRRNFNEDVPPDNMDRFTGSLFTLLLVFSSSAHCIEYSSKDGVVDNSDVNFEKFSHSSRIQRQTRQNTTIDDEHDYYTSTFYRPGPEANGLWMDISKSTEELDVTEADLSNESRYFIPHLLPFSFPFYGHTIRSVAITTSGFLYTSEYYHPYIYLTQYIAPLQADFNPSFNETSKIFILSSDDRFTVQWDKVHNNDHFQDGPFTFQVSLFKNGTIHFVYREIPLLTTSINNDDHPVEVGLADSFYVDELYQGGVVVRSIYEYHRIQLNSTQNLAFSAYVIDPVPNCVTASSCTECSSLKQTSSFDCEWCGALSRCSDGVDRFRQQWFTSGCVQSATYQCHLGVGAVVGISVTGTAVLLIIIIVISVIACIVIGYKRPTSRLGLFLIEHRPKARSLNKTKASYSVESGKTVLKEDTE